MGGHVMKKMRGYDVSWCPLLWRGGCNWETDLDESIVGIRECTHLVHGMYAWDPSTQGIAHCVPPLQGYLRGTPRVGGMDNRKDRYGDGLYALAVLCPLPCLYPMGIWRIICPCSFIQKIVRRTSHGTPYGCTTKTGCIDHPSFIHPPLGGIIRIICPKGIWRKGVFVGDKHQRI
jgi:hypothetical protein